MHGMKDGRSLAALGVLLMFLFWGCCAAALLEWLRVVYGLAAPVDSTSSGCFGEYWPVIKDMLFALAVLLPAMALLLYALIKAGLRERWFQVFLWIHACLLFSLFPVGTLWSGFVIVFLLKHRKGFFQAEVDRREGIVGKEVLHG